MASTPGVFPITVQVKQKTGQSLIQRINLVVRGTNLATIVSRILADLCETATPVRDAMWLTVPHSLHTNTVNIIRDGKRLGEGSTFYSITRQSDPRKDFYGYEWREPQSIGLLAYHTGTMEENGG